MFRTCAIIVATGIAGAAGAQTIIDLSGIGVDGGSPVTFTVFQHDHGPLLSIDFDIAVEHFPISWGSETGIILTHVPSGYVFTADGSDANFADTGAADLVFGWGDSPGVFGFIGSYAVPPGVGPADTYGLWTVTLFDEFDDFALPDHVYLAGSTITITKVPGPAPAVVLAIGAGFVARRRR